ncbi:Deoxyribodipyrimidine photo-lyase [Bagarius yarrelli]|uniref:Deoxyribodipyrimidine photo-lyase n=1 Tax=Bagarius yarrelli TaxID=175774 RepID=A0A556TZV4_BAGYA|nr:Deoxyribodipyrimidine photo-lyase [Bagarius yarrelli]
MSERKNLKRKGEPVKSPEKRSAAQGAEREAGWLQEKVAEIRRNSAECKFNMKRLRILSDAEKVKQGGGAVLYWMARDQRVQDNWALIYAQQIALQEKLPLHVCFCLVPRYLEATYRQYAFMLRGLQEVAKECSSLDIQFHLLSGEPELTLPDFVERWDVSAVVTDFNPLRLPLQWIERVKEELLPDVPLFQVFIFQPSSGTYFDAFDVYCSQFIFQVDAHNVVPCWETSNKLEYAARTIRGKITKRLSEFLTEFPLKVNWEEVMSSLEVDRSVGEVSWAQAGTAGGMAMLESFIDQRLRLFATERNNPNANALSQLSPWFHSGQISAQRALLEVQRWGKRLSESVAVFTEELLVRRELSDNFCFYNQNYDNINGAYDWAKKTLQDHAKDPRPHLYTKEQLEKAETYDQLWNAAQRQLVIEGKMHGFMRMYWAKKILEWTASPEEAVNISIYLNDRYALDGCDPNGYVGCMWSVCGIHDQGWAERLVFGKVRYMNYAGCKRKFDVGQFEKRYAGKKT